MSKKLFAGLLIVTSVALVVCMSSDVYARKKQKVINISFGSMNSPASLSERATIGWEKWIERESA